MVLQLPSRVVARYPNHIQGSASGGGGVVAPDFEEDWSTYSSTVHMQSNPNGWFAADQHSPDSVSAGDGVSLTQGIMGAPWVPAGVSVQACRTTFNSRANTGGESMYGKVIDWRNTAMGAPDELWWQWYIRFDPTWTTNFGRGGQFDHKTFSYDQESQADGVGLRWETKFGITGNNPSPGDIKIQIEGVLQDHEPTYVARIPPNTGVPLTAGSFFNPTFRRAFAHTKIESAPGANDGAFELWIEGQKVFDHVGIGTGRTAGYRRGFVGATLGRNLNQIPNQTQWFEFGRIRAWKTNPGLH